MGKGEKAGVKGKGAREREGGVEKGMRKELVEKGEYSKVGEDEGMRMGGVIE